MYSLCTLADFRCRVRITNEAPLNLDRPLAELRDEQSNIVNRLEKISAEVGEGTWSQELQDTFGKLEENYTALSGRIEELEAAEHRSDFLNRARGDMNKPLPRKAGENGSGRKPGQWSCMGERLSVLALSKLGVKDDPRLANAALGLNENVSTEGGIFVDEDTENDFSTKSYGSDILSRCSRTQLSGNSNRLTTRRFTENSRADGSRAGGVQAYWEAEAQATTATNPTFEPYSLDLLKVMAVTYVSEELLSDATALQTEVGSAFLPELLFKVENAIINGSGANQPLGILSSPAKVSVSAETGQTSSEPLLYENICKMYARMHPASLRTAVWLVDQTLIPHLFTLGLVNGTAGTPVYLPPNGAADAPYGTIFGRPVLFTEHTQAANTEGDIVFWDPMQYRVIEKGGVKQAASMHVQFLTDQMAFRWTYRVNGAPKWPSALTPKNSGDTLSNIITLATRT